MPWDWCGVIYGGSWCNGASSSDLSIYQCGWLLHSEQKMWPIAQPKDPLALPPYVAHAKLCALLYARAVLISLRGERAVEKRTVVFWGFPVGLWRLGFPSQDLTPFMVMLMVRSTLRLDCSGTRGGKLRSKA